MTHGRNENGFVETSSRRTSTNTNSSSRSSSSSIIIGTTGTISTEPGVHTLTKEQWDELASYYERCVLCPLSMPVAEEIREYNEHYEIGYDVIRLAMRETGLARRPSPRYFLAILDRCACQGVSDLNDWKAAKAAFHAEKCFREF